MNPNNHLFWLAIVPFYITDKKWWDDVTIKFVQNSLKSLISKESKEFNFLKEFNKATLFVLLDNNGKSYDIGENSKMREKTQHFFRVFQRYRRFL